MRPALVLLLLLAACSRDAEPRDQARTAPPAAKARPAEAESTPAATLTPTAGEMRTFREWEAACDNVRTCTLFGFQSDEAELADRGEGYAFVRIERAAGGDADPLVTLGGGEWSGEEQAPETELETSVDGGRIFRTRGTGGESGPYYMGELRGPEARALIAAMRNGRRHKVQARGFEPALVTLEGAAAALLWMDERQGRVGTTTALARPGSRPASDVPAAPAPPAVRVVRTGGATREAPNGQLTDPQAVACRREAPEGFTDSPASRDHLGGDVWL